MPDQNTIQADIKPYSTVIADHVQGVPANSGEDAFELPKELNNTSGYYEYYRRTNSPEAFKKVLKSLEPTINYTLASYNATGDPYIVSTAKILAARAIKKYDPSYNVSLPTYLSSQLRKLTRVVRDARSPIKLPERHVYEAAELKEAEQSFMEEHGREPDLTELADYAKMPIKKIKDIRSKMIKQVSEGQYFNSESSSDDDQGGASVGEQDSSASDFTEEALMYVHNDLDHRQKKILEWSTGYGGSPILSPAEIANRLKLSQSQISRITAGLAAKVHSTLTALNKAYGVY